MDAAPTRILVPIDFSPAGEVALTWASSLARSFEAELVLLHVLSAFEEVTALLGNELQGRGAALEEAREEARARAAEDLRGRLDPTVSPKPVVVVRVGNPVREILGEIEDSEVDLVVVGTHSRQGLARVLLGSVAERVVRLARVPVLVARPPEQQEPPPGNGSTLQVPE